MDAIWNGRDLPFTSFDPNVTPHEFVEAARAVPDAEVRDQFVVATPNRAAAIAGTSAEHWGDPSLSPLGAVPWWMSALHIFWDSWMHERDALLPIGIEPPVLDDELRPIATYVVGIAATLVSTPMDTIVAGVRVRVGGQVPEVTLVRGTERTDTATGELIDALCGRGPLIAPSGADPAAIDELGVLARLLNG
jgi:hypothetical protein